MKTIFRNKKGQQSFTIASIGQIAIALLVVAIIIGLSTTIMEKIKKTADDNSGNTGNITLTWAGNNTAIGFSGERLTGGASVFNGTGDANDIPNTRWVIVPANGTIIFHNDSESNLTWDTSALVVNADTLIGSAAFNISGFGIEGQSTLAEFIPTIAIIAIAAVVIGILLIMFGRLPGRER